jgi:hypothetical protein
MIVIYYESIRWNSWNHFGCDVNENIVRETGNNIMLSTKRKKKSRNLHHVVHFSKFRTY